MKYTERQKPQNKTLERDPFLQKKNISDRE